MLLCRHAVSVLDVVLWSLSSASVRNFGSLAGAKKIEGGDTYYQYPVYNHRGDVVRLTDQNGNTTATYEYNAWGEPLCAEETGATNRLRYQSNWMRPKDSEGDLLLSPTRLHHTRAGRFLGSDPRGRSRYANLYNYARGNPLSGTDPLGLWLLYVPLAMEEVHGAMMKEALEAWPKSPLTDMV